MSRIAQRTQFIAIALIVPALAAIAFTAGGGGSAAARPDHTIVAGGPTTPPPDTSNNHCPTCLV